MSIMVRLERIRRTDEFIETEYYLEDTTSRGYIKIDNDKKVIEKELSSEEGYLTSYFNHARKRLVEYLGLPKEKVPEKTVVMWY